MLGFGVAALVAVNLVAAYVYGIASFGNGLVFQVGWQLCSKISTDLCSGSTSTASFYVSVAILVTAPVQALLLRDKIDWKLGVNLSIPQIITAFIGVLLSETSSPWFPRGLGAVMFSVAVIQLMLGVNCKGTRSTSSPTNKFQFTSTNSYVLVWITGLLSGLFSGKKILPRHR